MAIFNVQQKKINQIMKKFLIAILLIATQLPSYGRGLPIAKPSRHQINLHLGDNYDDYVRRRRGTKMMIVGTVFLVGGVILDTSLQKNGVYKWENHPYSTYASVGAKAIATTGLLLFIGGLNNVLIIKF